MATNKKPEGAKTQAKTEKNPSSKSKKSTYGQVLEDEVTVMEQESSVNRETAKSRTSTTVKRGPTVAKRGSKKAEITEDPEEKIESAINRTEAFIYENGKTLLSILAVLIIIVGGFLSYKYLYLGSRSEKAGAAIFAAEQQFAIDSFAVALNGDGNNYGFLDIIDRYGSTPQGNIAKHYAGICYLKLGQFDQALEYLQKYKTSKGSPNEMINAQNYGMQGDIYVQKGDYQKATDLFQKAVDASDNALTTPYYLKKLAMVYDKLGRPSEAKEAYQRIADEYPTSMEGRDVEKYIGAEEQK